MHALTRVFACVVCGLAFVVAVPLLGSTADAVAVGRGIVDHRLETAWGVDLAQVPAMAQEMGPGGLRAKWTRILVHWAKLQPLKPGTSSPDDKDGDGYADRYVEEAPRRCGRSARAAHQGDPDGDRGAGMGK